MAKLRSRDELTLVGVTRRRRAALAASTVLQAGVLLVLALPAAAQPAPNAQPVGGTVVAGAAAINRTAASTTINQTSQRAALNWQSFNVGSQQLVTFQQPSPSAITLNRVISPDPSQIAGRIDANGQVVLVNQSGVTFFKGAQVNAAGLLVSAAGITDANFLAGRLKFDRAAKPGALVENQGTITVNTTMQQAGLAALVAPQVVNSGTIIARFGHVVLAGAKTATVDLYGDGLLALDVTNQVTQAAPVGNGTPVAALVTNSGTIVADGGTVQLTARAADGILNTLVQAGGTISAATLAGKAGSTKPGTVVLNAIGGSIVVDGQLAARGDAVGTAGGTIGVSATGNVTVASGAAVDASGQAGGGLVAIGTTLQRAKRGPSAPSTHTARNVTVQPGATIAADAMQSGNGGRVTVLATNTTQMDGSITARGGAQGGAGGFVEVSGGQLGVTRPIDVSAPHGAPGSVLLDPQFLDIVAGASGSGSEDDSFSNTGTVAAGDGRTGNPDTITAAVIDGFSGNVLLQAIQTITVAASVNVRNGSLTLEAGGNITVNAGVAATASGDVVLSSGGGLISVLGSLGSAHGAVGLLTTAGGTISIGPAGSVSAATSAAVSSGGPLTVSGTLTAPAIALTGAALTLPGSVSDGGAGTISLVATAGTISQTGTLVAGTLSGSATGAVNVGGNSTVITPNSFVATLGSFSAGGDLKLNDRTGLLVAGAVSAGTPAAPNTTNASTLELLTGGALRIGVAGGASGSLNGGLLALSAAGTISEPNGTVSANTLFAQTAGSGDILLSNAANQISQSVGMAAANGQVVLADDANLLLVRSFSGSSLFFELTLPGGTLDLGVPATGGGATLTASSGGRISLVADVTQAASTSIAAPGGTLEVAPFSAVPETLGATGSLLLSSIIGGELGTLRIGGFTDVVAGSTAIVPSAASIALGGPVDLTATAETLDLRAIGSISQPGGQLTANDLIAATAGGNILLDNTANKIATVSGMSAGGGQVVLVDASSLALTGTHSGGSLFYEVAAAGGTLALGSASLATTAGGRVTLVADTITAGGDTIATGGGTLELSPFSTVNASLFGTTGWLVNASLLDGVSTGTLTLGGFTDVPAGATTASARASSVSVDGTADLTGIASSLVLLATGAISEPGGPLIVAKLGGAGSSVGLTNAANAIGALGPLSASGGNITLADASALTVAGAVTASGNVFVTTPNAGGIAIGAAGSLGAGAAGLVGMQASTLAIAAGGGVSGGAFEFAPRTSGTAMLLGPGGSLASLAGITTTNVRLGAVTPPGAAKPTVVAGSIATTGTFDAAGLPLELDATGAITGTAGPLINVAVLSGRGEAWTLTAPGATIDSLGSIAATSFALSDAVPLTVAGSLSAATIALTTNALTITGAANGTGSVDLVATAGTIGVSGALAAATLTGSASGADFAGAETVATLGDFTAAGFTLTDGVALTVAGKLAGGSDAVINAVGTLTVTGSVRAALVSLTADALSLPGTVSDGGAGSTSLTASTGSISATGTLIAGTLSGSAAGNAGFTGSNSVAALGNFSAAGFTLTDNVPLNIVGTLAGGPHATITDVNALTVSGAVQASAVALTGSALSLPGTVSDGSAGTVNLVATAGAISQSGTLVAGTLTGTAAGAANLSGSNSVAALGNFSADGFTLADDVPLSVAGTLAGGSGATITEAHLLTVAGSVTATAVSLNAGSLAIPGSVSDGGVGTVNLTTTAGTITETGTLIAGTLSGSAAGAASFSGSNRIAALGDFGADGTTLSDTVPLTVAGSVAGGSGATITDAGLLTVSGSVTAAAVSLRAGSLAVPGAVVGGSGAVDLIATSGAITASGTLVGGTLSGSAAGTAILTGSNTIAALADFIAAAFTLTDAASLSVAGTLTAPRIAVTVPGGRISLATGATIVTGGSTITQGPVAPAQEPSNGAAGGYFQAASFVQTGSATLSGQNGGPATLQIAVTGNIQFDPTAGLQGTDARLILDLTGGKATGAVRVSALDLSFTAPGSAALSGAINGVGGQSAASLGSVQPASSPAYQFNGCIIGATACGPPVNSTLTPLDVLELEQPVSLANLAVTPLREVLRIVIPQALVNPVDSEDLLEVPVVSEQDY